MAHINSFGNDFNPTTPAYNPEATKPSIVETPVESGSLADVGAPVGKKDSILTPAEAQKEKEVELLKGDSKKTEPSKAEQSKAEIKEEIKNLKKKFALTVDGKNEELELDLGNDEEVKKYLQKARAADKRFQEAAEVRKAAMEFLDQLKKNPKKVLSDPNIGVDVRKFAEEILNEEIKEMEKSPEQREREKLQRELEELKAQAKQREEQVKAAEFSRLQTEQERILETEISAALDVGGMPKTARTVKAMAEMMMIALENNIDLSPKDIAPLVKNNTLSEMKEVINSLSDDQVEDFFGKELISRLRKKNIAKAKTIPTASAVKSTGTSQKMATSQPSKPATKQTFRQFFGV